jgi:hypothetical protein
MGVLSGPRQTDIPFYLLTQVIPRETFSYEDKNIIGRGS